MPLLRGDDRGVLHGEGVFETLHLRPDGPWLLDAHLDRLAASARLLELPPPDRDMLRALALAGADAWTGGPEGALRLVGTRGPEDGTPTWYATVSAVPGSVVRERRGGVRVVTADLGVSARHRPPWSLAGAKSLSYATQLAARRWAVRQGADDLLWLSSDGYALEAPTASLVWLAGNTLCTVPAARTPILPGTTAAHLLSRAGELGLRAEPRMITGARLPGVDALWLASSLRGLAEIRALDGTARPASPWTSRLLDLLGFPA
ncbi:aminotransferase class IV [Krasilnikovia sp. MM14-A1259]|uniref:aminotransferase class IV n=1 Tax=Krasilnikovia sp. MM14-A1259 TaxID=3373539 RepID=UPI00399CDDF1